MRSAVDLTTLRPIRIDEVVPSHGRPTIDGLQVGRAFECPFCRARMRARGETARRVAHFAHGPGQACPSTRLGAQAFAALRPRDADPAAAQALRIAFRASWWLHFLRMRDMIAGFSVDEFVVLLHRSLQNRIWNYRNLELWEIPYTLALLADFSPATAYGWRPAWYRFWVRDEPNDRLWIWPTQRGRLLKGSFTPRPQRGLPKRDDLLQIDEVATTANFLTVVVDDPHDYIRKRVEEFFTDHASAFND